MGIVVLRHDLDRVYSTGDCLDLMFEIEAKYNVFSTNFIRFDRGIGNDRNAIKKFKHYEDMGHEFGVHLSNHINDPKQPSPKEEFEALHKTGLSLKGISFCGSVNKVKTRHPVHTEILNSTSYEYFSPHMWDLPKSYCEMPILPNHITFEPYLEGGDNPHVVMYILQDIDFQIEKKGAVTFMSHPDYLSKTYIEKRNKHWGIEEDSGLNAEYYNAILEYITDKYEVINCIEYKRRIDGTI